MVGISTQSQGDVCLTAHAHTSANDVILAVTSSMVDIPSPTRSYIYGQHCYFLMSHRVNQYVHHERKYEVLNTKKSGLKLLVTTVMLLSGNITICSSLKSDK